MPSKRERVESMGSEDPKCSESVVDVAGSEESGVYRRRLWTSEEEEQHEAERFAHLLDDMGVSTGGDRLLCRCPRRPRERGLPNWLVDIKPP